MDYKEILTELSKKIYRPVYILHGEEPYYIDLISNYIEQNILSETEKDFNQTVVYGKDTNVDNIVAIAKRYPMMAQYQVVIVKEAQNVKNLAELKYYVENPLKSTILVICHKYKKIDGKLSLIKLAEKNGCVLNSEKIRDYNLPTWIKSFLTEEMISYEYGIPELLAEYLGNDLHKIVNEINKLKLAIPKLDKITKDIIEKHIGISKEYNDFELQDAFAERNLEKIFRILKAYSNNPKDNSPQRIIPNLFSFYKNMFLACYMPGKSDKEIAATLRLNEYVFKNKYCPAMKKYTAMQIYKIISVLREYDLKTKGVNSGAASPTELMREMALKILTA